MHFSAPGNTEDRTPEESSMRRALDPTFAPKHAETAFSDAMPFLVANEVHDYMHHSMCPGAADMEHLYTDFGSNATACFVIVYIH